MLKEMKIIFIAVIPVFLGLRNPCLSSTENSGNIAIDSTVYDIVLNISNADIVWRNSLKPYPSIAAGIFCPYPGGVLDTSSFIKMDSVFADEELLQFKTFWHIDTTFRKHLAPVTWKIVGNSGFPSFTYTNTDSFPTYDGYPTLPDTLFNNQSVMINVAGFNNADKVEVLLQNSTNHQTIRRAIDESNNVTFLWTEIEGLISENSNMSVSVILSKYSAQTIGFKRVKLINQYSVIKNLALINSN